MVKELMLYILNNASESFQIWQIYNHQSFQSNRNNWQPEILNIRLNRVIMKENCECKFIIIIISRGFPGGTVVKNPPANAGDTGSSPGPGRSYMPRSN